MAVYTYTGNLLPGETTEQLILRGGSLIVSKFDSADFSDAEYAALSTRYRLSPGAGGTLATPTKALISFTDLADVFVTPGIALQPGQVFTVNNDGNGLVPAAFITEAAIQELVDESLASSPDILAAAQAAAVAAVALQDFAPAETFESSDVVFGILDEESFRSWLEIGPGGGPTPEAAEYIVNAISSTIVEAVASQLGIEFGGDALTTGISFAILDADGFRGDLELDASGHITDRVMDLWAARIGTGPGSVTIESLDATVAGRLSLTVEYVPEVSAAGKLLVNHPSTGDRKLIVASGNPRDIRLTADGYVTWTDDSGKWARVVDASAATVPLSPTEFKLACFGDSMTEGPSGFTNSFPNRLATELGLVYNTDVFNGGKSGQASSDIAIRQGGLVPLVTVTSNQVPASGAVTITAISPSTSYRLDSSVGPTLFLGTLAGVPGTLTIDQATDVFSFTRTTPGSIVSCPAGTPFYGQTSATYRDWPQIIWVGRNNTTTNTNFADARRDIASMVAYLRPYTKRYLIFGVSPSSSETNGTPARTALDAHNQALEDLYGSNFFNVVDYMATSQALADASITPTVQDLIDIANGIPPLSLRNDSLHFNPTGDLTLAKYVEASIITPKGWYL